MHPIVGNNPRGAALTGLAFTYPTSVLFINHGGIFEESELLYCETGDSDASLLQSLSCTSRSPQKENQAYVAHGPCQGGTRRAS